MAWLYPPPLRPIDGRNLLARLRDRSTGSGLGDRLGRLALLGVFAVALGLAVGGWDLRRATSLPFGFVPLVMPNPWLTFQALWGSSAPGAGPVAAGLLLAVLWLRALAALLPLLPIVLTLRGTWAQLTLVFALLLFVVGDFAPLMIDQPYPSGSWLLARTGLGLARSAVLGGALALLLGLPPRRVGGAA
jgi:hypothetical protein